VSSLLELIARRRRASADRRLGPPGWDRGWVGPVNGNGHGNGNGNGVGAPNGAASPNGNGHGGHASAVLTWPAPASTQFDPPTTELAVLAPPVVVPHYDFERPEPEAEIEVPEIISVIPDPPLPAAAESVTPGAELELYQPGFLARIGLRRRLRYLRRVRELQLRDIGGFALELYRFGRRRPELVLGKIEGALQTDRELRLLERLLLGRVVPRELREPGIGGVCPGCGAVHGSADRFCASCGRPLTPRG
jgi:hypothetical protein